MDLKVGDIVEFKKYADMSVDDTALIREDRFPEYGKVTEVNELDNELTLFNIEGSPYVFNSGSVARVISDADDVDIDSLNQGDEVLIKATVNNVLSDSVWLDPVVFKNDVVEVLERKEEHFIVQEDQYKMYVIDSKTLSLDKSKAKVYNSRNEANDEAADMHLNAWDVINYDA